MLLITGASGFIGSHLAEHLSKAGYEVLGVDRNPRPPFGNWRHVQKDVNDFFPEAEVEGVFHLSAEIDVRVGQENPRKVWEDNIRGTYSVLEWGRKYDAPIIFSSSAAVYGNPVDAGELPLTENAELKPTSAYGVSKKIGEELVRFYGEAYGIPFNILRYFNVYGPRSDHGVIYLLLRAIKEKKPFTVFGDGRQTRDFIFVSDVVEANLLAFQNLKQDAFNISTGKETSLLELISLVEEITGERITVNFGAKREEEIMRSAGSPKKAEELLGWRPKVSLKEGLRITWRSLQSP